MSRLFIAAGFLIFLTSCASVEEGPGQPSVSSVRMEKLMVFSMSDLKAMRALLDSGSNSKKVLPSGATGICVGKMCTMSYASRTVPILSERGPIGEMKMVNISMELQKNHIDEMMKLIEKAKARKGIVTDKDKILSCYAGACSLSLRFGNMGEATTETANPIKSEVIDEPIKSAVKNSNN